MKKKMKIPLMVFCVLAALVLIDTLQAKALNRAPILKAVEDYNGGDLYQKHKGILADTYVFTDGSQKTVFKWEKIDTNREDIMMDLPIPTHLQPFFTVIGDKNDEYSVTGTIHCSCGCEQFEVWESNDRGLVKQEMWEGDHRAGQRQARMGWVRVQAGFSGPHPAAPEVYLSEMRPGRI